MGGLVDGFPHGGRFEGGADVADALHEGAHIAGLQGGIVLLQEGVDCADLLGAQVLSALLANLEDCLEDDVLEGGELDGEGKYGGDGGID